MENRLLVELVACGVGAGPTGTAVIFREHACVGHSFLRLRVPEFALNVALVCTSQVIDRFLKLTGYGKFSRYGIINTKTTGFVFLFILPFARILSLGSPALQYAGTDRLQMVGVGSLHVDDPLLAAASFCRSCQRIYSSVTFCSTSSGLRSDPLRCKMPVPLYDDRRSRRKKEEQRSSNAIES